MASNQTFIDACFDGDFQKVQTATANESLTAEDLNEGLALATDGAYPEVVAAFFAAGATMSEEALDSLPGARAYLTSDLLFFAATLRVCQGLLITTLLFYKGLDSNIELAK